MHTRPSRRSAPVVLLLLVLAAAIADAAVPCIRNPAEPPTRTTAELRELWRLGGEEDGDILLGLISDSARDAEGNVFILDYQLCHVLMISPQGELIRTLSREGDGPGEVRMPGDLLLFEDGIVGIKQGYPGKVVCVHRDDTPAGSIVFGDAPEGGNRGFIRRIMARGDRILLQGTQSRHESGGRVRHTDNYLALCDREGHERCRYAEATRTVDYDAIHHDEERDWTPAAGPCALGAGGEILVVPERNRYLIQVWNGDGELLREIERDQRPHRRTDEEMEDVRRNNYSFSGNIDMDRVRIDVSRFDRAIQGLFLAADGTLWVSSSHSGRDLPDGILARYDVHDAEGRLREELSLACPGYVRERDAMTMLDGTHVLVIEGGSDAWKAYSRNSGAMHVGDEDDDGGDPDEEPIELAAVLYEIVR